MRDTSSMRARIGTLRRQAQSFLKQSERTNDRVLRERLVELAKSCADVATNIERNLSIHERVD